MLGRVPLSLRLKLAVVTGAAKYQAKPMQGARFGDISLTLGHDLMVSGADVPVPPVVPSALPDLRIHGGRSFYG